MSEHKNNVNVLLVALIILAASCVGNSAYPPDSGTTGGTSMAATPPATGGSAAAGGVMTTGGSVTTGGVVASGGAVTTGGTTSLPRDAAPPDAHDYTHCPEAVVTVDSVGWTLTNTGPGVVWSDWSTLPYDHITPKGCPTGLMPAPNGGQDSLARSCIPSDATTLVLTIHCRDPGQANDRAIDVRDYPVGP